MRAESLFGREENRGYFFILLYFLGELRADDEAGSKFLYGERKFLDILDENFCTCNFT